MNNYNNDSQNDRATFFNYNATLSFLSKYDNDNFFALDMLKSLDAQQQQKFSLETATKDYIPEELVEQFAGYYIKNLKSLNKMHENKNYLYLYLQEFHKNLDNFSIDTYKLFIQHLNDFSRTDFRSTTFISTLLEKDFSPFYNNPKYQAVDVDTLVLKFIGEFRTITDIPSNVLDQSSSLSGINPFHVDYIGYFVDYLLSNKDKLLKDFYNKQSSFSDSLNSNIHNETSYTIDQKLNSTIFDEFFTIIKNSCDKLFENEQDFNKSMTKIFTSYFAKANLVKSDEHDFMNKYMVLLRHAFKKETSPSENFQQLRPTRATI